MRARIQSFNNNPYNDHPSISTGFMTSSPPTPPPSKPKKAKKVKPKAVRALPGKTQLGRDVSNNLQRMMRVPLQGAQEFLNKFRFVADTNYRMGCQFADQGLFRDAVFRLKVALWFSPDMPRAWYVLGSCYYAQGRTAESVAALQHSLRLKPDSEETIFMLAYIDSRHLPPDKRPLTMPRHMAIDYFDRMADSYDFQQREMGYVGHVVMDEALRSYVDVKQINLRLLDLGCGTGLLGYMMADVSGHITGVDFSRHMLDHAMRRKRRDGGDLYVRTILRDMREYLHELDRASFDLVAASHVFNFVGDLEQVFVGVAKALKEDGIFAFQVEPYPADGFGMLPGKGRFSHSDSYIRRLSQDNGLEIVEHKKEDVYPNYPFDQYVLRKKPSA